MTDLKEMERVLKALASRRRLAIVRYLKNQKKGSSVQDISEVIKLSYKSTSHHLRLLASAGLLNRDQNSVEASYSLVPQNGALTSYLTSLL